ncbi:MAG TPA: serine hydrolase domain-containing protein, partial [Gemmatimonadaceae bacterium]
GLIVERTSGISYAEYVRTQLFERAGMRDSRYCDASTVVPRRARGYQLGGQGLERAHYLDHTWPFAAGSLCSTVADLDAWNRALHGGKILGAGAYREMIAPGTLADGTTLGYAKGLGVGSLAGHPAIHHGGAISGFLSYVAWFPERELSIAVSVNTMGPVQPLDVVRAIARSVLGEPAARVARLEGKAADYVGEYRGVGGLGEEMVMHVSADSSGALLLQSPFSGPTPRPLTPLGEGTFGLDDNRVRFVREDGRVTGLSFDATYALIVLRRE